MDYLKETQMKKKKNLSDSSPAHQHLCIFSKKVEVELLFTFLLKSKEKLHDLMNPLWHLDSGLLSGLNPKVKQK